MSYSLRQDGVCDVKIHSKLRPEPLMCSFKNLQDNFDLETYIPLLQIYLIKAQEEARFD